MATALDLLMSEKEDVNLHSEESDICTIDAKTRAIFVPSTIVVGGVQSDKNAERIKFSCPKIVGDNLDLSKFSVRINFENVSSVDFNVSIKDQYICDDVAVDGENVTFSWLIGRNAARYMGTVRFIVCAVKTDSDSNISVEWNTAIAEVPVLEGIEIDQPQIGQEEKDVINQLLDLTKNTSAEAVQNVNSAKEQAIKDIQSVSQPDTTLTIEGGLAEAKATGEAIGSLKEDIAKFEDDFLSLTRTTKNNLVSGREGNYNVMTGINLKKGKTYCLTCSPSNDVNTIVAIYLYDENNNKVFNKYIREVTTKVWSKDDKQVYYFTPTEDYYNMKLGNYYRECANDVTVTNTIGAAITDEMFSSVPYEKLTVGDWVNAIAYFAGEGKPTFEVTASTDETILFSSITVTFDMTQFRLYRPDGGTIVSTSKYSGQSFTLNSGLQKLVYDLEDDTIKIVTPTDINKNGKYILLLFMGYVVSGALKPYYDAWAIKNRAIDSNLRASVNMMNGLEFFGDNYTSCYVEGNTSNGNVFFKIPNLYIRGIINKSYNMDSIASDCGATLVTSTKGIEGCLQIENTLSLVFDITTSTFKIVARNGFNKDRIPIIIGTSGRIIYVHPNLMPIWYVYNKLETLVVNPSDISGYYANSKEIKNIAFNTDFKFMHITDLHGSTENINRVVTLGNALGASGLNAIINTGDTVARWLEDGLAWYNSAVDNSNTDVLTCVGNHDAWSGNYFVKASATDIYNAEIKPVVQKVSDIVQPNNAEANGYNFYYKDYGNVRVIVLDAMVGDSSVTFWDDTQKSWFESALTDARTNGKAVICASHAPFKKSEAKRDENLNWNSWVDYRTNANFDAIVLSDEATTAVDNFISNGGTFICWVSGHTHVDNILTDENHPNQIMLNMASSARYNHSDGQTFSDTASGYYDCINYCGVDLTHGLLKVHRIGWNMDASMKVRNNLCYDFKNHKIVSSN